MIRAMGARSAHRRRSPRVRVGRSVVAVALCLSGMVLAAAFLGITVQANALAREKATLQAEIASTLTDQSALKAHIATQKTDDYVTQLARNLGLIGQNETLFGVQRDSQSNDPSARGTAKTTTHVEKWIAFFFGSR